MQLRLPRRPSPGSTSSWHPLAYQALNLSYSETSLRVRPEDTEIVTESKADEIKNEGCDFVPVTAGPSSLATYEHGSLGNRQCFGLPVVPKR
jgi:hypothetical protein